MPASARAACILGVLLGAGSAVAQPSEDLARYFGFDPMRIIVVDDRCGPIWSGDVNGDGRPDLVVVNNRKSRIEIHYLRESERDEAERRRGLRANELPPSPWYDRVDVSVSHAVTAFRLFDADRDGALDLVYAGANPSELVVLRQESPDKFSELSKRRVPGLSSRQGGLAIVDVMGDPEPELVALAEEKALVLPLDRRGQIGEPVELGSGGQLAAIFAEDFNGDGMSDLLAVVPDSEQPLRLWLQSQDPRVASGKAGQIGAELRFEMPGVREVEPIRFAGRSAASIGVIERASRRMVFSDLIMEEAPRGGELVGAEREVRAEVVGLSGPGKDRSLRVVDLDGDGLADLLATDSAGNTVVFHRQSRDVGMGRGEPFGVFKEPKSLAAGQWDGAGAPEVFVLSEKEKAAGVATFDPATGRLGFPVPLPVITPGASPVAMDFVTLDGVGGVAVIVKDRRDHALELHLAPGSRQSESDEPGVHTLALENVKRPPQSMLAADADQDGRTDLMLFTPNEPMVMIRAKEGDAPGRPSEVLTDATMPQFGLVQAAGPDNTALLDIDGDGKQELLLADQNFVRACVYDAERGWRVVEQITVRDAGTNLVGLTTLGEGEGASIIAADQGNNRLLVFARKGDGPSAAWGLRDRIRLLGFTPQAITAGSFGGDGEPGVLCVGDTGFAVVRLGGQRFALEPFAVYRSDNENLSEFDMEPGDVNGDGLTDLVVLESGEQLCQVFAFTTSRRIIPATSFEVFESRLFTGGSSRTTEPRDSMVADVTGDGADDIVLLVHDRVIIYPQATRR